MITPDVVEVLEDRLEFLEGIREVAYLCNWTAAQIDELHCHLLEEIIRIDNVMFDVHDETGDPVFAYYVREKHLEDLRRWLTLIFGIKIRFF